MRWLLFLSRLAFICGIFFLLSLSLLFWNWAENSAAVSSIIVIGYFLGMIIVPIVMICYLGIMLTRKKPSRYVPTWLAIANFFFFLVLIFYIIYQNVQDYPAT